jgi:hypothetical protein
MNLDRWMSKMKHKLKDKQLNEILLPSSHDSAASMINYHKKFKSKNFWLNLITNSILRKSTLIQTVVNNWTLCQNTSIYEQLKNGIRVFDIRVGYRDIFYTTHTFLCQPLDKILDEFKTFNKENPEEVIIIAIKIDSNHRNTYDYIEELHDKIDNYFGNIMYPRKTKLPTYGDMLDEEKTILITMNNTRNEWSSSYFKSSWVNKQNIKHLEPAIIELLKSYSKDRKFKGISYTITPNKNNVLKGIFCMGPKSIEGYSPLLNDQLNDDWKKFMEFKEYLSIIFMDYPSNQIIELIINENI